MKLWNRSLREKKNKAETIRFLQLRISLGNEVRIFCFFMKKADAIWRSCFYLQKNSKYFVNIYEENRVYKIKFASYNENNMKSILYCKMMK